MFFEGIFLLSLTLAMVDSAVVETATGESVSVELGQPADVLADPKPVVRAPSSVLKTGKSDVRAVDEGVGDVTDKPTMAFGRKEVLLEYREDKAIRQFLTKKEVTVGQQPTVGLV